MSDAPRTSSRPSKPSQKQHQIDIDRQMKELEAKQKALRSAIRHEQEQEERRGYSRSTRPRNPDIESEEEPDDHDYDCFTTANGDAFELERIEAKLPSRFVTRNGNIVPAPTTRVNQAGTSGLKRVSNKSRSAPTSDDDGRFYGRSSSPIPAPSSSPSPESPLVTSRLKRKVSGDLDDDNEHDPAGATTITMKKVKVTVPTAKGSRQRHNVGDFEEQGVVKEVLEDAIGIFRALVSTQNGFPNSTTRNEFVMSAWVDACKRHKLDLDCEAVCAKLIRQRASQIRGQLKTVARPVVDNLFGLSTSTLSKRELRDKVELLLDRNSFIYRDPVGRKGIFQHPSLQAIVNQTWFKNSKDDGPSYPQQFSQDGKLPLSTIALVFTATECILDQWVTGEFCELKFAASTYQEKYNTHLANLQAFEKKTSEAKIIPQLCEHLLKVARRHAKVVDVQQERQATFTDDDISAAVDDWKEFPLSEGQDV